MLDDAQTLPDTQIVRDADDFTLSGPLSIAARPSCHPEHSDNRSSYCHGSVFQQDTVRNQPRPSKCSQMPNIIRRDDAECLDDDPPHGVDAMNGSSHSSFPTRVAILSTRFATSLIVWYRSSFNHIALFRSRRWWRGVNALFANR